MLNKTKQNRLSVMLLQTGQRFIGVDPGGRRWEVCLSRGQEWLWIRSGRPRAWRGRLPSRPRPPSPRSRRSVGPGTLSKPFQPRMSLARFTSGNLPFHLFSVSMSMSADLPGHSKAVVEAAALSRGPCASYKHLLPMNAESSPVNF